MGVTKRRPKRPPIVRTVVVGLLKGGTGKTTTAWFIALWYALQGYKVKLLDADPVSQTAYSWYVKARKRGYTVPIEVERYPYADIATYIDTCLEDHDVVVVDVGGGSPDLLMDAVSRAQLVVLPVSPAEADEERVPATLQAAEAGAGRNPGQVLATIVLTKADHRTSLPAEARKELTDANLPLAKTEISAWTHYIRAMGHIPSGLAEYEDLMIELSREYNRG
ncbi:ParA family protein [Embleya sp. NPDC005575]|uniref:ParA family protein n=1 Tax=Embleya sp. NPDC005575 TaxID=3156892 RepID=UPI0033A5B561